MSKVDHSILDTEAFRIINQKCNNVFLMGLNSYVIFATNYASKEILGNLILKIMKDEKRK